MPRSTNRVPSRNRRKNIVKSASGYRGRKSKCYRIANRTVEKGMLYQYRDRRNFKREIHSLWITRINAFAREIGLNYSKLISALTQSDLKLNKKMLVMCINNNPMALKSMLQSYKII